MALISHILRNTKGVCQIEGVLSYLDYLTPEAVSIDSDAQHFHFLPNTNGSVSGYCCRGSTERKSCTLDIGYSKLKRRCLSSRQATTCACSQTGEAVRGAVSHPEREAWPDDPDKEHSLLVPRIFFFRFLTFLAVGGVVGGLGVLETD